MARAHGGRQSRFHIDDSGGTLRDISVYVTNVEAPSNIDQAEITGFGDARKSYILGQIDSPVTVQFNFDDAAAPGVHAVLAGLIGGTAGYTLRYFPKGSASGMPMFAGETLLSTYNLTSPLGGQVTGQATFVPMDTTGLVWSTL